MTKCVVDNVALQRLFSEDVDPLDGTLLRLFLSLEDVINYYGLYECEFPLLEAGFTGEELKGCQGRGVVTNMPGDCWSQFAAILDYGVKLIESGFTPQELLMCDAKQIKALHNYRLTLLKYFQHEELIELSSKDLDSLWSLQYLFSLSDIPSEEAINMAKHLAAVQTIERIYHADMCNLYDQSLGVWGACQEI